MIQPIFIKFDTVTSTNDVALKLAKLGSPEGTIVTAHSQSAGRGRRGRIWLDEPGQSVLMSIILRPDIPAQRFYEMSFLASLAVADCLRFEFSLQAQLKWPNDVLVNGQKICGVLVETESASEGAAVIVGIGINVNQKQFPGEISDTATSIALETNTQQDVEDVVKKVVSVLLAHYERYRNIGFKEILDRWRSYMYGIRKRARVITNQSSMCGKVEGVNETGALVLRDDLGNIQTISSADSIQF
ncbi:MAG: biotin--[acetyl-CoA-carboxylase] ligase [Armatimonadota bacterium]